MSLQPVSPADPHLSLYEIFARVWLHELSRDAGAPVTLATVPDAAIDRLAERGFDLVYLMGVWTLGAEGPRISRSVPALRAEYDRMLPGWTQADVVGSPFAIARYAVNPALGGDHGLAVLRRRLAERGIGLILDFVPNHVARDHHWITERPELFIRAGDGTPVAGRDPYFAPWPDTAQLDLRLEATHAALIEVLADIATRCDGVRCDMAMLVLRDVFARTWAELAPVPTGAEARGELWAKAIDAVRAVNPGFVFIAEVYWGLEWRLQMLGFDYTYDKILYDRLVHGSADSVRAHLQASADYQRRSVRFVENHDEPRSAAVLAPDRRRAATLLAATVPGMRFFHHGQLEGRTLRASLHLARAADEPVDAASVAFHETLLAALRLPVLRGGSFALLAPQDADAGAFVAYRWDAVHAGAAPVVVVVNLGPDRGTCRIPLDIAGIAGRSVMLVDLLTGATGERSGDALLDPARGLDVELPGFGALLLEVHATGSR